MREKLCLLLIILSLLTIVTITKGNNYMDLIILGDSIPEAEHNFSQINLITDRGGYNQTNRKIGKDGLIYFTLKVEPEQNNFTVKLWGSDVGQGMLLWEALFLISQNMKANGL